MTTGTPRSRARRRWSDDAIRAALSSLIGDTGHWPTCEAFSQAGLTGLETILRRRGEKQRWMEEFGVGIGRFYSVEQLEAELKSFTEGMVDFPTRKQFEEAGLLRLLSAVRTRGGPAYWAERLGLTFEGPIRGVKKRFYTTPEFEAEMKRFCDEHGGMPSERQLKEAGRRDLITQVKKHGGYPVVAGLLGLPPTRMGYSDACIEAELLEMGGSSGRFPTASAFTRAGRRGLYNRLLNRGERDVWAEKLGLKLSA